MNKPKRIPWKKLPRNVFSRNIHSDMLKKPGMQAQMYFVPKGAIERDVFLVEYDREYVLSWILKKVLIPLGHLEEEEVIRLIKEAYNYEQE